MRLRTPLTELVGIEHRVVQTGNGLGGGRPVGLGHLQCRRPGHPASATMTIDELATAIAKVKSTTDKPFGVNIRADAADAGDRVDLMIREGVKVASFALAPKQELDRAPERAGAVRGSVGGRRHTRARWRAGVRTR